MYLYLPDRQRLGHKMGSGMKLCPVIKMTFRGVWVPQSVELGLLVSARVTISGSWAVSGSLLSMESA